MPSTSDLIREFVNHHWIEPARRDGTHEVSVRSGEVHERMLLRSRMPQVCGALGANLFAETYRVSLLRREGPQNGANLVFTFRVLP